MAAQVLAVDACFTTSRLVWLSRRGQGAQAKLVNSFSQQNGQHEADNATHALTCLRDAQETRICSTSLPIGARSDLLQPTTSKAANGAERLPQPWMALPRLERKELMRGVTTVFHRNTLQ